MKSLGIMTAAVAALLVAGCRASSQKESDGMMSGKEGSSASAKKEGQCPFQAAAQKDDCCASEAKSTDVKKSGCCAEGKTETKTEAKGGCCGDSDAKIKSGCCKGKDVSAACAECKKACEASGGCDAGKKCDEKPCEEKPKP